MSNSAETSHVAERSRRQQTVSDDAVITAAAKIVSAYVAIAPACEPDDLIELIRRVGGALVSSVGEPESEPEQRRTMSTKDVVSSNGASVKCLECGWHMASLRRHLKAAHGLTVEEYRSRWWETVPVTAPAYSKRRSELAIYNGLGVNRRGYKKAAQDV